MITRRCTPGVGILVPTGYTPTGVLERSSASVELHCAPIRIFAFDTEDNVIDQNMLTVFAELNQL